jgi:hypothetical protein
MAYDAQHMLVTFRGKQFTSSEDWSFGLRVTPSDAPSQTDADLIADLAKTWITTASSGYAALTTLAAVKVAHIGTNGLYVPGSIAYESFPTSATGSYGSAVVHPPQIALAMTLQSSEPRGPVHQTHVFLPGPHFPLETASSARITTGQAGNVLANFRTLVNGINSNFAGNVSVMSKKFGLASTVFTLRCGRVFDTMRSRRASIGEDYQSLLL